MSPRPLTRRALFAASAMAVGVALAGCTTGPAATSKPAADGSSGSVAAAKPSIASMSPATGGVSGGEQVTLSGSGLGDVSAVTFGGVAATVVSASGDRVIVTAPSSKDFAAGAVDVALADAGGTALATKAAAYSYAVTSGVDKQMAYAMAHWSPDTYNTAEWGDLNPVGGDCANFVSQTLIARGWQQDDSWYNRGAAKSWSPAWGYVPAMDVYFEKNASRLGLERVSFAEADRAKIALGDVAIFDWNDNASPDHVQVVDQIVHNSDGTIDIKMASHNKDFDYRDLDEEITTEHPGAIGHFWHLTS